MTGNSHRLADRTRSALEALSDAFCLVTGGLGFIGSNVTLALAASGARVAVVDALVSGHGGDRRNLDDVSIPVTIADISDRGVMTPLLRDADVVFNIAGQVSHVASMVDPARDFELNVRSHLTFLS